jgi:sulfate-transporting ATPase
MYTGGPDGTTVGAQKFLGISLDPIVHPERYAIGAMVAFILACLVVANLRRGRAGRRLIAVRANERAAASLGVSIVGAKVYAFAISAAIAALGGILLAFRNYSIIYDQFDPIQSIM